MPPSNEGTSRRPRAKNKKLLDASPRRDAAASSPASATGTRKPTATSSRQPTYPLAALLWPARAGVSQWVVLAALLMAAGLFRWAVALWGYSGYQTPPMYGDFEAQRHWMEITTHLPIAQWYFHDLEWWGLDYPPLTAYHSWLLGKIGSLVDPSWFALHESRGLEDARLKLYMRATVLGSEYLIYVPALVVLTRRLMHAHRVDQWESNLALAALLLQPATMLVDHGHFQYNTVMLGFMLASLSSFFSERWLWCCVFFVAAIGFKQMALYYAPAVFACLLGVCFVPRVNLHRLTQIAATTALSFLVLFAPFLVGGYWSGPVTDKGGRALEVPLLFLPPSSSLARGLSNPSAGYYPMVQQLAQAIHRIFPFARGIFEDKVANVWCVLNVLVKLRAYPVHLLQRAALAATVAAILPPCLVLFLRPRSEALLYGVAATAWGFFLCSFQVHEKSVLLPLLPMTMLLAQRDGLAPATRSWVGFANMLGVWTMYPLLKRDELRIPFFVVTLLWAYLMGLPPGSFSLYSTEGTRSSQYVSAAIKALHLSFYASMVLWHVVEAALAPPPTKPDLWVVLNAAVGAAGFAVCYLWCVCQALTKSGLLESGRWKEPFKGVGLRKSSRGPPQKGRGPRGGSRS